MENMSQVAAFRINAPRVTHQTIDGETIIIDFENGAYFSIDGVGSVIWEAVAQNTSANAVIDLITKHYAGDNVEIKQAVEKFMIELQHESPDASTLPIPTSATQPEFQTPMLTKYTDMQDLLLLDPIHDVDEQGWPLKKNAEAE